MKMKLINPVETEDGVPRSFYTYKIPFGRLCHCIASCPGVQFTSRPRFFWSGEDTHAEFRFKGHDLKVETIWADTHVGPKDEEAAFPEIVEIENHVEQHGHTVFARWWQKPIRGKARTKTPTTESNATSGKPR
jgi:hypothetical protein